MITLAVVGGLLICALIAALSVNEARRRLALPTLAATLYDGAAKDAAPLIAHSIMVEGRPTAVERTADGAVTVLCARSGLAPPVASSADVMRLGIEMLVAEEALGVTVMAGLLRFQDRSLTIPHTPLLRALVSARLGELRAADGDGPRLTRQDPTVCRACAYRAMCAIGRINAPAPHSA